MADPLPRIPLWFIEGLAENVARDGLAPEAELMVRDLLVHPDLSEGFAMLGFFDERPSPVLWTYQVGAARCAFLEAEYGAGSL